ncbi:MAG: thiol reductant ABC exporter subunit CydC [Dehalococcoidia bacterium]|nr:thiol reductant ABC exporter subunit CydC [Dehalococcoidia bacterium]
MLFNSRLYAFTAGLRWRILLAAALGLAAVPLALWRLVLIGTVVADLLQGEGLRAVTGSLVLIGVLLLVRVALDFAKEHVANGTSALVKVRLRRRIVEHALALGPGHFVQKRTGDVIVKLVESVERLTVYFGVFLPQLLVAALTPLLIFAFVAALDVRTALIYIVCAAITLSVPLFFRAFHERASSFWIRTYAELGAEAVDNVQGLPTLKAFGQSRQRGVLLSERTQDLYRGTMKLLGLEIWTSQLSLLAISLGTAIALVWGAYRVQDGAMELSTLIIVLLLGVEVFRPLRETVRLYHSGTWAMGGARGIFELLDTPIEIREQSRPQPVAALVPTLSFENVTFAYQAGRRPALRGLSFDLCEGETLGVVGPSGAGKSTMVNLILRFVEPGEGCVLLGGVDLRELPLETLRDQVAVVAQDTYLFHGTVADNLRIGGPGATLDELHRAAELANAHEFITQLPDGYDTLIGERGVKLSGGQRQRIAIARALLKDAPILILDEALSSVDAENEHLIREALERLQANRTTLVIAHRLSSVVNADRILVLEQGVLSEVGTHAELVRAQGTYARLMAAQQPIEEEQSLVAAVNGATAGEAASAAAEAVHPVLTEADGRKLPATGVWLRLLRLTGDRWWELAIGWTAGIAGAAAAVGVGVMGALLVREVVLDGDITPYAGALLIVAVIATTLTATESWVCHDLAFRLLVQMRNRLYRLIEPLAPAYLQRRRTGDVVSLVTGDVETLELFYAHSIAPALTAVFVPIVVVIVLATFGAPLALVLVPFLVCVALTPLVGARLMASLGERLRASLGEMNAVMVDSIQGIGTVLAFGESRARLGDIDARGTAFGAVQVRFLRNQALQRATIELLTGLGGLAVLATGAALVTDGNLGRTELPLVTVLAFAAFAPVAEIVNTFKQLSETLAAARRYFAIEDEPVLIRDGTGVERPARPAGSGLGVAFEGVSFAYPGTRAQALRDVSFDVPAGTTVALVGRSGAGKTTAAHLLLRFWDPDEGSIGVNGRDLRDYRLEELRDLVALVAQDTYLFNTSLLENLRLGNPAATDEQVYGVARQANVEEFALALPDGYATTVGERGLQLSGGQRQRVAIARALLKDAPILVLDEATSHLDAVNEAEIRGALDALMRSRTTLVIAHRLSTIRNADRIVVLDGGRVVESGSHTELLAREGHYARLVGAQLGRVATSTRADRGPLRPVTES